MSIDRDLGRLARKGAIVLPATAELLGLLKFTGSDYPALVRTLGFSAPNDGGAAEWWWDASATDDTPVSLAPDGHSGPGRWRMLWTARSGPVDLRAVGITSDEADAPANTAALRALCGLLRGLGGGEVYVPDVGVPWAFNAAVWPWLLDYMTIRGPGELRHVDPGNPACWYPAALLSLGSYGGTSGDGFLFDEPAYAIADASGGASEVVLDDPGDAANVAVGDLICVHDGRYYLKGGTTPRYHAPQVREVTSIAADTICFRPALTRDVGHSAQLRVMNTGVPGVSSAMLAAGFDRAYLSRYATIDCRLSHAPTGGAWGLFNPNLGFRTKLRGDHVSGNGVAANLQVFCDVEIRLTTDRKGIDFGYASEGTRADILLDRADQSTAVAAAALIYLNEATHGCDLSLRTLGPVRGMTGTHIVAAPYSQGCRVRLDVDFPDWITEVGAFCEASMEANETASGDPDMFATDLEISGRVRVGRLEQWGLFGAPSVHTPYARQFRFRDLELAAGSLANEAEAWRCFDFDGVMWERVRCEIGDFSFTRPGGFVFRDCDFPNSDLVVTNAVAGYERWIDQTLWADRVLDTELERVGQLNRQKDGILRAYGGLQSYGPLYHTRAATAALGDGDSEVVRTSSQLGPNTFWVFFAGADNGAAAGMAFAHVSTGGVISIHSIYASEMQWSDMGGTDLAILNPVGGASSITLRWTGIQL